jgi:hypothetical protein
MEVSVGGGTLVMGVAMGWTGYSTGGRGPIADIAVVRLGDIVGHPLVGDMLAVL